MANHFEKAHYNAFLFVTIRMCVWVFFMLSAYVLARGWDGRYWAFLTRRVIRLWPIYALCLTAGCLMVKPDISLLHYFFWPVFDPEKAPHANSPMWSLTVEVWAMPLMPVYVWIARQRFVWFASVLAAISLLAWFYSPIIMLSFFFIGAWLTRFELRWAPLEHPLPQWLGRLSYPLYLCHWPIIWGLTLPPWVAVLLVLAVADLLSRTVEKWSIQASRAAPKRLSQFMANTPRWTRILRDRTGRERQAISWGWRKIVSISRI